MHRDSLIWLSGISTFLKKSHVNDVSYTSAFLAVMSQNVYHEKRYVTSISPQWRKVLLHQLSLWYEGEKKNWLVWISVDQS